MSADQGDRLKQLQKDTALRRKRYEALDKQQQEALLFEAKAALERRKLERQRMDNLMRNPYQAPPPPSKPILRRRARSQPHSSKDSPSPERREGDQARRGWNEGLKEFIARQRQEKVVPKPDTPPLSWQELKVAAEAGFEELLAHTTQQQQHQGLPLGYTCDTTSSSRGRLGTPVVVRLPPDISPPHATSSSAASSPGAAPRTVSKWASRMSTPGGTPAPPTPTAAAAVAGTSPHVAVVAGRVTPEQALPAEAAVTAALPMAAAAAIVGPLQGTEAVVLPGASGGVAESLHPWALQQPPVAAGAPQGAEQPQQQQEWGLSDVPSHCIQQQQRQGCSNASSAERDTAAHDMDQEEEGEEQQQQQKEEEDQQQQEHKEQEEEKEEDHHQQQQQQQQQVEEQQQWQQEEEEDQAASDMLHQLSRDVDQLSALRLAVRAELEALGRRSAAAQLGRVAAEDEAVPVDPPCTERPQQNSSSGSRQPDEQRQATQRQQEGLHVTNAGACGSRLVTAGCVEVPPPCVAGPDSPPERAVAAAAAATVAAAGEPSMGEGGHPASAVSSSPSLLPRSSSGLESTAAASSQGGSGSSMASRAELDSTQPHWPLSMGGYHNPLYGHLSAESSGDASCCPAATREGQTDPGGLARPSPPPAAAAAAAAAATTATAVAAAAAEQPAGLGHAAASSAGEQRRTPAAAAAGAGTGAGEGPELMPAAAAAGCAVQVAVTNTAARHGARETAAGDSLPPLSAQHRATVGAASPSVCSAPPAAPPLPAGRPSSGPVCAEGGHSSPGSFHTAAAAGPAAGPDATAAAVTAPTPSVPAPAAAVGHEVGPSTATAAAPPPPAAAAAAGPRAGPAPEVWYSSAGGVQCSLGGAVPRPLHAVPPGSPGAAAAAAVVQPSLGGGEGLPGVGRSAAAGAAHMAAGYGVWPLQQPLPVVTPPATAAAAAAAAGVGEGLAYPQPPPAASCSMRYAPPSPPPPAVGMGPPASPTAFVPGGQGGRRATPLLQLPPAVPPAGMLHAPGPALRQGAGVGGVAAGGGSSGGGLWDGAGEGGVLLVPRSSPSAPSVCGSACSSGGRSVASKGSAPGRPAAAVERAPINQGSYAAAALANKARQEQEALHKAQLAAAAAEARKQAAVKAAADRRGGTEAAMAQRTAAGRGGGGAAASGGSSSTTGPTAAAAGPGISPGAAAQYAPGRGQSPVMQPLQQQQHQYGNGQQQGVSSSSGRQDKQDHVTPRAMQHRLPPLQTSGRGAGASTTPGWGTPVSPVSPLTHLSAPVSPLACAPPSRIPSAPGGSRHSRSSSSRCQASAGAELPTAAAAAAAAARGSPLPGMYVGVRGADSSSRGMVPAGAESWKRWPDQYAHLERAASAGGAGGKPVSSAEPIPITTSSSSSREKDQGGVAGVVLRGGSAEVTVGKQAPAPPVSLPPLSPTAAATATAGRVPPPLARAPSITNSEMWSAVHAAAAVALAAGSSSSSAAAPLSPAAVGSAAVGAAPPVSAAAAAAAVVQKRRAAVAAAVAAAGQQGGGGSRAIARKPSSERAAAITAAAAAVAAVARGRAPSAGLSAAACGNGWSASTTAAVQQKRQGILNPATPTTSAAAPAATGVPASVSSPRGGATAAPGGTSAHRSGTKGGVRDSMQQLELEESLERLNAQLAALKHPVAAEGASAAGVSCGSPSPVGPAPMAQKGGPRTTASPGSHRKAPNMSAAAAGGGSSSSSSMQQRPQVPTPNRAKALKEQRMQQAAAAAAGGGAGVASSPPGSTLAAGAAAGGGGKGTLGTPKATPRSSAAAAAAKPSAQRAAAADTFTFKPPTGDAQQAPAGLFVGEVPLQSPPSLQAGPVWRPHSSVPAAGVDAAGRPGGHHQQQPMGGPWPHSPEAAAAAEAVAGLGYSPWRYPSTPPMDLHRGNPLAGRQWEGGSAAAGQGPGLAAYPWHQQQYQQQQQYGAYWQQQQQQQQQGPGLSHQMHQPAMGAMWAAGYGPAWGADHMGHPAWGAGYPPHHPDLPLGPLAAAALAAAEAAQAGRHLGHQQSPHWSPPVSPWAGANGMGLAPVGHYMQTVMRDRLSTQGSGCSSRPDTGRVWSSAVLPPGTAGPLTADPLPCPVAPRGSTPGHGSSSGGRQQAADIWPPRGLPSAFGGAGSRQALSARSNDMVQHSDQEAAGLGHPGRQPGACSRILTHPGTFPQATPPPEVAAAAAAAGGGQGKATAAGSRSLKIDRKQSGTSAGVIRAYNLDVLLG